MDIFERILYEKILNAYTHCDISLFHTSPVQARIGPNIEVCETIFLEEINIYQINL